MRYLTSSIPATASASVALSTTPSVVSVAVVSPIADLADAESVAVNTALPIVVAPSVVLPEEAPEALNKAYPVVVPSRAFRILLGSV